MLKKFLTKQVLLGLTMSLALTFSVPALAADSAKKENAGSVDAVTESVEANVDNNNVNANSNDSSDKSATDSGEVADVSNDTTGDLSSAFSSSSIKKVVYKTQKVKTKISDHEDEITVLKLAVVDPVDDIVVNHGIGRKVFVEKKENGKWVVEKKYKAARKNASKKINVSYDVSKSDKTTKWRIRIPSKTVKQEINKKDKTIIKKTTYKGAVVKTKVVVDDLKWPLPGITYISSKFGARMCPFHGREFHPGIDIPASSGTKVKAAGDGVVIAAGRVPSFGKRILIRHSETGDITTMYNHLSKIKVKKGDKVVRGETIGKVGSTGDSTGPHLDFRVFINGKAKNPCKYADRK